MVLVVRLKRQQDASENSSNAELDTTTTTTLIESSASTSSHESPSSIGHDSIKPPIGWIPPNNSDFPNSIDDLTNAFNKASIRKDEKKPNRAAVSVYIAPAVLGHRYVRSISKAHIVERPERLRATLVGLSALVGKLSDREASNEIDLNEKSIQFFVSNEKLSINSPNEGLKMIHDRSDQWISDVLLESSSSAYIAFLNNLCNAAPSQISTSFQNDQIQSSEIPASLPQGDLYLCGDLKSTYFQQASPQLVEDFKFSDDHQIKTSFNVTPPAQSNYDSEFIRDGSRGAIEASLGTCCAALDRIVDIAAKKSIKEIYLTNLDQEKAINSMDEQIIATLNTQAFVIARPPGHHCTGSRPSGFCWVNNVAVMAAHAYAAHGIDRIAIFDFDLHHGDGTQSIVYRINEETVRIDAEREAKIKQILHERKQSRPRNVKGVRLTSEDQSDLIMNEAELIQLAGRRGLKLFYGSIHDIESFPCEDGDASKIANASMCIEGAHGQWIWNVHLESHANKSSFESIYAEKYSQLFKKAARFFKESKSFNEKSMIIISAGFDASVHELPGMQRHGKNVPPEFYKIFTQDAVQLAEEYCKGKLISVMEGGYSDRALMSGVASHLAGLITTSTNICEELSQISTLSQLERMAKVAASSMTSSNSDGIFSNRRKQDLSVRDPMWLKLSLEAFKRLEEHCGKQRLSENNFNTSTPATPLSTNSFDSPRETRSVSKMNTKTIL